MSLHKRNFTIDILRYICALLVVSIHISPLSEYSNTVGQIIFNISRIGLPYFLVIAGYYYIQKIYHHQTNIWLNYVFKLINIYMIWTIIYSLINYITWGYSDTIAFFKDEFISFFLYGNYYHLWFFPSLFFSALLVSILSHLGLTKIIFPIGLILFIINTIFNPNVPALIENVLFKAFPFFACGCIIFEIENKFITSQKKTSL